ncbi:hypothetical protein OH492_17705 [Vibrio chagasii]|nr:hypothetical protein [Vibrio chagasii]
MSHKLVMMKLCFTSIGVDGSEITETVELNIMRVTTKSELTADLLISRYRYLLKVQSSVCFCCNNRRTVTRSSIGYRW